MGRRYVHVLRAHSLAAPKTASVVQGQCSLLVYLISKRTKHIVLIGRYSTLQHLLQERLL